MARPLVLVALAFGLASCAGENSPARDAAASVGFAAKPGDPAPFVKEKRAQDADYMNIGQGPPERPTSPRGAADVKVLEQNLEQVRSQNATAGASAKAAGEAAAANAAKSSPR